MTVFEVMRRSDEVPHWEADLSRNSCKLLSENYPHPIIGERVFHPIIGERVLCDCYDELSL